MEVGFLQETKSILRSLVLSYPNGMTIEKLNRDYKEVVGTWIPFQKLGFSNIEHFLNSIPDTLVVSGHGRSARVGFVSSEKTKHINEMVSRQKNTTRDRKTSAIHKTDMHHGFTTHLSLINNETRFQPQPVSTYRTFNSKPPYEDYKYHNASPVGITTHQTNFTPQQFHLSGNFIFQQHNYSKVPQRIEQSRTHNQNHIESKVLIKSDKCRPENTKEQRLLTTKNSSMNLHNKKIEHKEALHEPVAKGITVELTKLVAFTDAKKAMDQKNNSKVMVDRNNDLQKEGLKNIDGHARSGNKPREENICIKNVEDQRIAGSSQSFDAAKSKAPLKSRAAFNNTNMEQVDHKNKTSTADCQLKTKENLFADMNLSDDIDEAVPEFAANNLVFRIDFPENTVVFGKKIPDYELPKELKKGSIVGVFISEIHSPFKFWFHIHKDNHELDILMNRLDHFYGRLRDNDLTIPKTCLAPGQVCAALYNCLWHRAEILTNVCKNKVKVNFVDYGTVSEVEIENVKYLPTVFADTPVQAIRGSLSHIKPISPLWPKRAIQEFLSMVSEVYLYAQIMEIDTKERTVYMVLCDTNSGETLQINKQLVDRGFAKLDSEWDEIKIAKKNQCIPVK